MGAISDKRDGSYSIDLMMPMLGDYVEFFVEFNVISGAIGITFVECDRHLISIGNRTLMDTQKDYIIQEIQEAIYEDGV